MSWNFTPQINHELALVSYRIAIRWRMDAETMVRNALAEHCDYETYTELRKTQKMIEDIVDRRNEYRVETLRLAKFAAQHPEECGCNGVNRDGCPVCRETARNIYQEQEE